MAIAKVEPLTRARALRGPFDYRLPARMGEVGVGSVLVVPFGRRRVPGVVVGLAERSELPPDRLAEPVEALEAGVPAELVRLGLWAAREYCSTPARGLGLVLPPGTGVGGQRVRARREQRRDHRRGARRARGRSEARGPASGRSSRRLLPAGGRTRIAPPCGGSRRAGWWPSPRSRSHAGRHRCGSASSGTGFG